MAIGWLTVLTQVPWADVIHNAPKVADGAKKLWKSVSGKSAEASSAAGQVQVPVSVEALSPIAMEARIRTLEAKLGELHTQMVASSELMKQLADQNTQLVRRIEANRVRMIWVAVVSLASLVMAVVALSTPN